MIQTILPTNGSFTCWAISQSDRFRRDLKLCQVKIDLLTVPDPNAEKKTASPNNDDTNVLNAWARKE